MPRNKTGKYFMLTTCVFLVISHQKSMCRSYIARFISYGLSLVFVHKMFWVYIKFHGGFHHLVEFRGPDHVANYVELSLASLTFQPSEKEKARTPFCLRFVFVANLVDVLAGHTGHI